MRRDLTIADLGDLLELRLLAVLATYRHDGAVLLSPVWHEWRNGGFGVVTESRGVKAAHLRRDPRASIVVCEHSPPYRGVELRGSARLFTAGVGDAVQRIASRYLGAQAGAAYAGSARDDLLLRLEPGELRAWDFADDPDFNQDTQPAGPGNPS
jgi:PPOX class probable F420-dependent enzyme